MKRTAAILIVFIAGACSDAGPFHPVRTTSGAGAAIVAGDVLVTNSNDAGPGSFREAITQANADPGIGSIAFHPSVNVIALQSGIVYGGAQDLTIDANDATLAAAAAGGTAFMATGGGDLTIRSLSVNDAAGEGIHVEVPSGATGTVRVVLHGVRVQGNTGHGFLVNDQEDPLDVGNPNGSAASVDVHVYDSRFIGNGYSVSDRDGIRVNEGGAGDLRFTIWSSRADDNAADGIELDEKSAGDVIIDVRTVHITRNGRFDPSDLDDGFDIDEAGDGSITGEVRSTAANHNYEEGLDFNENDAGDLRVNLTDVEANDNREEGIDYEEDDDFAGGGDLVTVMTRVTTLRNGVDGGDGGLKIREKGAGNLDVVLNHVTASQNSLAGIHIRETEAGDLRVTIDTAVTNGNAGSTGHGIEMREGSSGNIVAASLSDVTTSGNSGFGVSVENGTVIVSGVKGGGNGLGLLGGGATFTSP